jgi:hypothetical protein
MKSVGYMIQGFPSEALRFITAIRMPLCGSELYSLAPLTCSMSSWSDVDPILQHLTSLHLLGLPSHDDGDLFVVLHKCTALRHLHYHGSTMHHLEAYLSSQPRLDSFGVKFSDDDCDDPENTETALYACAMRAIDKLEYRPKFISFIGCFYNSLEVGPMGWARGASCVIFDRFERFQRLHKVHRDDALENVAKSLPLAADVDNRTDRSPNLESKLSIRQRAELYHYEANSVTLEAALEAAISQPDLSEYEFIMLIAASDSAPVSEKLAQELGLLCHSRYNMYKPIETVQWARNQLMFRSKPNLSQPLKTQESTISKIFNRDLIQQVKAGYYVGERRQELIKLVAAKNDIQLSFEMWANESDQFQAVVMQQLPIPDEVVKLTKFDAHSALLLLSQKIFLQFKIDPLLLLENDSILHWMVEYFTDMKSHKRFGSISPFEEPLLKRPSFVALVHRRTSVFQRWNYAATIFYSYFEPAAEIPHWQAYKHELDARLDEDGVAEMMDKELGFTLKSFRNVMATNMMPEKLASSCVNQIAHPEVFAELRLETSNRAISILKNCLPEERSRQLSELHLERFVQVVLGRIPKPWLLEALAIELQSLVVARVCRADQTNRAQVSN